MRIFIASPLFNTPQIEVISRLEQAIESAGHSYYSARQHSGSDKMTQEERKHLKNWDPVFESNVQGLEECDCMIAVLEYQHPEEYRLELRRYKQDHENFKPGDTLPGELVDLVQLPDSGTVWEMGYHAAQKKPVIGFLSGCELGKLNLMLTHGVKGLVLGFDALNRFLLPRHEWPAAHSMNRKDWVLKHFDMRECTPFDAFNKEVE